MAYRLNSDKEVCRDAILRGKRGEWYVQSELAKHGIDSKRLDFVYDLLLPEYDYKIEVKCSKIHYRPEGVNTKQMGTPFYSFKFGEHQIKNDDAYDWAVCVGLNDRKNIKDVFIIPQPYIAYNNKNFIQINIRPTRKLEWQGDSFTKFEVNKYLNLEDIFKQDNALSFKQNKTRHTNRLIRFGKRYERKLVKKIDNYLKEGNSIDKASKHFKCAWKTIVRAIERYNLNHRIPKRGEHLKRDKTKLDKA